MNKAKFVILTFLWYVFGMGMAVGIFYVIYFIINFKEIDKSALNIPLISFCTFSLIYIVLFVIWLNRTNQGKVYVKMYADNKESRIKRQSIEDIKGTEYYDSLPKYNGPETLQISESVFESLKQVTINAEGVSLDNSAKPAILHFNWDEIKVIGIDVAPSGKRIPWGFLYFTKKDIKKDWVILEYFEAPYVIVMKYSPKVIHCVLQYWDKPVKNLEAMKSWYRYIKKL